MCSVDGCGRPVHGHGLCGVHYNRQYRHGSTDFKHVPNDVALAWITAAAMSDTDECIDWPFGSTRGTYGRATYLGRQQGSHRISFAIRNGRDVREGLEVLHSCDNPPCCNPRHLREGTKPDNMMDRGIRGRTARPAGERNGMAKLTADAVRKIRSATGPLAKIAADHGINAATVSQIRNRARWKHVP